MIVTSPGKVLILGGYAVIDGFPALSIALLDRQMRGADASAERAQGFRIISEEFGIDRKIDGTRLLEEIRISPKHERISVCAVASALAYMGSAGHRIEGFTLRLDNSPIFGEKDEKSGLGSSAATTVSAVGAVFESNDLPIEENRNTIHKVSQISHSFAAGRIGSGFDIATSAFGSLDYKRYAGDCVDLGPGAMDEAGFTEGVGRLVAKDWSGMEIRPFRPEGFGILVFNIRGGKTSTVSSVRAIRKLIEYAPEIYRIQISKQAEGERIARRGLAQNDPSEVRRGIHIARDAQDWMGQWASRIGMMDFDPIEPPPLTRVIDEAEKLGGVVAGRCPGSGGYDSLAFLIQGVPEDIGKGILDAGRKAGVRLERIDAQVSGEGLRKV
ncbi:MAG: hypothetical protein U0R44_00740 [Candidatus Micrarchaeia archaeon]